MAAGKISLQASDGKVLSLVASSGMEYNTTVELRALAPVSGIFYENNQVIASNYTLAVGKNAMTAGPITINDGVTITISDGSSWTIV